MGLSRLVASVRRVAVRMWGDASAITRLIERNPAMSCAAEVAGHWVGTVLRGHDGWRGWLHHVAVEIPHGDGADSPQRRSAAGWRQREDLSPVSSELSAATLH